MNEQSTEGDATVRMSDGERRAQRSWAYGWGATLALCAMVFLALAVVVASFGVVAPERRLYEWINLQDTPSLGNLFSWINELGDRAVLFPAALLMVVALPSGRRQPWWSLIAVLVLSWVFGEIAKEAVGRATPESPDAGFPSDRVAAVAGFAVVCAYLLQKALVTEIGKAAVWIVAVTCVAFVSVGRIVVHAHWPLDILGGAILGLACAAAVILLINVYQVEPLQELAHGPSGTLERAVVTALAAKKARHVTIGSRDEPPVPLLLRALYYLYQRRLSAQIREGPMPRHLGIILDGNRRYGSQRRLTNPREIYLQGAQKLDDVLGWCSDLHIPAVTLWVLSADNLARPADQVSGILSAIESKLNALAIDPQIHRRRIRVRAVGRIHILPESTRRAIEAAEAATSHYDETILTIAVAYGGREEIADAIREMLRDRAKAGAGLMQVVHEITPTAIGQYLYTVGLPDPDLIIRTSGEIRLSGFLMWQSAYSEFYFSDVYWPALRKIDLLRAVRDFQRRKRRFGR